MAQKPSHPRTQEKDSQANSKPTRLVAYPPRSRDERADRNQVVRCASVSYEAKHREARGYPRAISADPSSLPLK